MSTPAVGLERKSKVVGYKITKGDFRTTSPNLPQRIAVLAEANTDNQAALSTDPVEITSAQQAGKLYGFGSPIYNIMRILRPVYGDGVGGIPVIVYPQLAAVGSTARVQTITPTGNATGNGVHTLVIGGRKSVDGSTYDVNIVTGDTPTTIAAKMNDVISAVLGCPVKATTNLAVTTTTTKWTGLTAQGVTITVDNNGNSLGVTYAVAEVTPAAGTPSIASALQLFGSEWNTSVINSYGAVESVMAALEQVNGIPDPDNPTGRYAGIVMKPFIALTGSVLEDPSTITDTATRSANVTIAICPAPLSQGLAMEAAANMAVIFTRTCQDTPHLDVNGKNYPDMPTPTVIGAMAVYNNRDAIVKKGCSTVDLVGGYYQVSDFVTTYHPEGEEPPQFRYCRNLNLDFNVRYGYYLLEQINVVDHAIAADTDDVAVGNIIKPKQWKSIVAQYAEDLSRRALIAEKEFMQNSITVDLSTVNPDRLDTFFRYKRTGIARISSTTAEAGFNFGTL